MLSMLANITTLESIVDWGFASRVPLQLAGRMPAILELSDLALPPGPSLREDRRAYTASLELRDSHVAASWLLRFMSAEDVDLRQCFLESLISKGTHRRLASLGWKLPVQASDAPEPTANAE